MLIGAPISEKKIKNERFAFFEYSFKVTLLDLNNDISSVCIFVKILSIFVRTKCFKNKVSVFYSFPHAAMKILIRDQVGEIFSIRS